MSGAHIDPHARTLLLVGLALLVLLAATVGATFMPWPPIVRSGISLAIALAKAALIFWFFMHGRELNGLVRIAAVIAGLFIAILLALTGADYATRRPVGGDTFGAGPGRNGSGDAGLPP